jgi:predicted nucleotidyltransferase
MTIDQSPSSNLAFPRHQVIDRLRAELPIILRERPVMIAYLYGSVAEGYALPNSDIDLALVLTPDHGLSAYQRTLMELDIAAEIEERCGLYSLDVRSINEAPVMAQGTVLTEGVILYSRQEDFRVEYEVLTRKKYFDFLPVARMMQRAYFEEMDQHLRRHGAPAHG